MRTQFDFSQHKLEEIKSKDTLIYHFYKPGTRVEGLTFINSCGIMAVTGDFGNWIFCREFWATADGYVSDGYWIEKLQISSTQEPREFDEQQAIKDIKELREDHEFDEDELEFLQELEDAAGDGEYSFIAKIMDRPSSFDTEMLPRTKNKTNIWLEAIFDAFDTICKNLKAGVV